MQLIASSHIMSSSYVETRIEIYSLYTHADICIDIYCKYIFTYSTVLTAVKINMHIYIYFINHKILLIFR